MKRTLLLIGVLVHGAARFGLVGAEPLQITDFYLETAEVIGITGGKAKVSRSDFPWPIPVKQFDRERCLFRIAKNGQDYWIHGRWVEVTPSSEAACDPKCRNPKTTLSASNRALCSPPVEAPR